MKINLIKKLTNDRTRGTDVISSASCWSVKKQQWLQNLLKYANDSKNWTLNIEHAKQ